MTEPLSPEATQERVVEAANTTAAGQGVETLGKQERGSTPFGVPSAEAIAKQERLFDRLTQLERAVVAFSGGVDSAYLLAVAADRLASRVVAFTARSPSLPAEELEAAAAFARNLGVAHEILETHELDRAGYVENAPSRCYFCKTELFDAAAIVADRFGGATVLDGFNADDLLDHRPGHRAAAEHAVLHPLAEAGLTKQEIRDLSRARGLSTWNKPQLACLASRIPYGTSVTEQRLRRIGGLESALRQQGFVDLRARLVPHNDDWVRIEVGVRELGRLIEPATREAVVAAAHALGFTHVTLDLEGFRSGRLNDALRIVT